MSSFVPAGNWRRSVKRIARSGVEDVRSAPTSLSGIWLVSFVAAAITFMVWMKQVRHNADVITSTHQHRFTKVWVFVGWFIPIANLYIPYAVMQDIWRGSDRSQPTLGLQHREPSGLVLLWWLCFLVSNFSVTLPPKYAFQLAVFATISADGSSDS